LNLKCDKVKVDPCIFKHNNHYIILHCDSITIKCNATDREGGITKYLWNCPTLKDTLEPSNDTLIINQNDPGVKLRNTIHLTVTDDVQLKSFEHTISLYILPNIFRNTKNYIKDNFKIPLVILLIILIIRLFDISLRCEPGPHDIKGKHVLIIRRKVYNITKIKNGLNDVINTTNPLRKEVAKYVIIQTLKICWRVLLEMLLGILIVIIIDVFIW